MPANRRELDSLVKRKTRRNLGSNRKTFNVNLIQLTYIFYTNAGGLKCFQLNFQSFFLST